MYNLNNATILFFLLSGELRYFMIKQINFSYFVFIISKQFQVSYNDRCMIVVKCQHSVDDTEQRAASLLTSYSFLVIRNVWIIPSLGGEA